MYHYGYERGQRHGVGRTGKRQARRQHDRYGSAEQQ